MTAIVNICALQNRFILGRNARTVDAVDRWGSRPIDDARRANHAEVVVLLQAATDEA